MKLALSIANTPIPLPTVINPLLGKTDNLGGFYIGFFLNVLYFLGIVAAMAFILYGGWRWITSKGDPKEVKNARETIVYSLVGLTVIFLAMMLVNVIGAFFGIDFFGVNH